jgi:hypothetical protein
MIIYLLPSHPLEGVVMRRHHSGVGCGACGRGRTYPRSREAPGSRPSLLRGTALNGWTRCGGRAAEAARIRVGQRPAHPHPEATAPGTEKPLMERREAPASWQQDAARRKTGAPLGAPSPRLVEGRKRGRRRTRRRSNNTGAHARPFGIRALMLGWILFWRGRNTFRSFPRKRESSSWLLAGRLWVPAFAGTSGANMQR